MRFITPGGKLEYYIPVIKMQKYSLEEIWGKKFYFFDTVLYLYTRSEFYKIQ